MILHEKFPLIKNLTIGWQNLNPLSTPISTLAPQARISGEILNYLLLAESLVWYPGEIIDIDTYLSMHLLMVWEREASATMADWCWMILMFSGVTAEVTPTNRSSSMMMVKMTLLTHTRLRWWILSWPNMTVFQPLWSVFIPCPLVTPAAPLLPGYI